jgi:aldose 1-epimerase
METLRAGDAEVTIDHDRGGRLSSLVVAGHELLRAAAGPDPDPTSWGCFPMLPWAGRVDRGRFRFQGRQVEVPVDLAPHAIHGTTKDRAWSRTGEGTLRCDLGPSWPWAGWAEQVVELSPGRLTLVLRVHAATDPMPVSAGWHPWLRRRVGGASARVELPAERMWQRGADGIPDGTLVAPTPGPWDDCFTALVGPVQVTWPGVLVLRIDSDCEHVVVFDEPDDAVCVEPQSAPPDAHNSEIDLAVVAPGEPLEHHMVWTWTGDPSA